MLLPYIFLSMLEGHPTCFKVDVVLEVNPKCMVDRVNHLLLLPFGMFPL